MRPDGIHMALLHTEIPNQAAKDLVARWLIPFLEPFTPAAKAETKSGAKLAGG